MRKTTSLLAFLIFVCASAVLAQDVTGSIAGTVLDASGAGIPNAKVTITATDRNHVVRTITTDSTGNYSAPFLDVGKYSVTVEAPGFKKAVQQGIALNVNDKLTVNVPMEVGDVSAE